MPSGGESMAQRPYLERSALVAKVVVALAALLALYYYDRSLRGMGPTMALAIGAVGYVAYSVLMALVVRAVLPRTSFAYISSLVDAAAVAVVLSLTRGVQTPFVALGPAVAAYHGAFYGYGPGVAAAAVVGVGLPLALLRAPVAGVEFWPTVVTWVPLGLLVAVAGAVARLGVGRVGAPAPGAALQPLPEPEAAEAGRVGPKVPAAGVRGVVAGLRIDAARGQVFIADEPVSLSPTEVGLLRVLVAHVGTAVGHDDLRQQVWGPGYTARGNVVDVTVHRLRRKLERHGLANCIVTVRGRGYMLSPVEEGPTS
ncbi:MAG: winged helix-turn-helix domain-containing protein [Chloroflexi bacterium]|nr:winged helix-turn-helix domain-containing protein [Chloroflexota bacterium]